MISEILNNAEYDTQYLNAMTQPARMISLSCITLAIGPLWEIEAREAVNYEGRDKRSALFGFITGLMQANDGGKGTPVYTPLEIILWKYV